ncbi:HIT-like domain-containing protein [Desarmillaria tabescens]|uniref:Galactose-1-phosphate uridylyltransferase n=1 Tax=Armillaria tabescens TaxID=1929756 RepID=A0AA39MTX1_ARMTA|nr:HIT-like domain-containing protein [Desarmillaria tabescens]KAK0446477.1 HIT-like domain-containing protein [Desarmillaria tabescens]
MTEFNPSDHPHRRLNPLTGDYTLVSPHRIKRPWLGQVEPPMVSSLPQYDPACYLCPGNTRAGGHKNPDYQQIYVFENDFSAVLGGPLPIAPVAPHPLLATEPVGGGCDVLIFDRRHDLTLARISIDGLKRIIEEWIRIYYRRGAEENIKYVQIFENKGSMMGCSNPHPHGQAWSLSAIPSYPAKELENMKRYTLTDVPASHAPRIKDGQLRKPCLLCEYVHAELNWTGPDGRIVFKNEHWVAVVPWWAVWPFEILLLPYQRHIPSIAELTEEEKTAFAQSISIVTKRYDNLFSSSFAYSMGIHQRPIPLTAVATSEDSFEEAHLHLHFTPPLLRSATVKKFMVGFDIMGEAQRDLTPEIAATRLRECSDIHYLDEKNN